MKKNVVIAVLSVLLIACIGGLSSSWSAAARMRVASRLVRISSGQIWKQACEHAAEGDRRRSRWCEWATQQTVIAADAEGVTDAELEAFAVEFTLQQMNKKDPNSH